MSTDRDEAQETAGGAPRAVGMSRATAYRTRARLMAQAPLTAAMAIQTDNGWIVVAVAGTWSRWGAELDVVYVADTPHYARKAFDRMGSSGYRAPIINLRGATA